MKNKIIVDFDSEREDRFLFSKPPEIARPKTQEQAKEMILLDIGCLSEAIVRLILLAHDNGYVSKDELIFSTVNTIYQGLNSDDDSTIVEESENQKLLENNQENEQ